MRNFTSNTGILGAMVLLGSLAGCGDGGSKSDTGSASDGSIEIYASGTDGCIPTGEFAMDCPSTTGGSGGSGGGEATDGEGSGGTHEEGSTTEGEGSGGTHEEGSTTEGEGSGGTHEEGSTTEGEGSGGTHEEGSTTEGGGSENPEGCPVERPAEQAECSGGLECSYPVDCGTRQFNCREGHWVPGERPTCEGEGEGGNETTPCGPQEGEASLRCNAEQICVAHAEGDARSYGCEANPCLEHEGPNSCECAGSLCGDAACELHEAGTVVVCSAD